jgi:hypothetical protein
VIRKTKSASCNAARSAFSKVSNEHYGCSAARNRGTCDNRITIRRDVLEASVLSGLKTHLMQPELVKEFIAEYHRELNRLNASREGTHAQQKDELARVDRQIRAIIEAIKDGMRTSGMKDELLALESRKAQLASETRHVPAPAPRLHPKLADIYRDKVSNLNSALNAPATRAEAAHALRALIDEIRLVPENGRLEIELAGDLAGIPPASMRTLLETLSEQELMIAAQVHSHPFEAFHSKADDAWAIVRHVDALSLVLPRLALRSSNATFLADAKLFRLTAANRWVGIENARVGQWLDIR